MRVSLLVGFLFCFLMLGGCTTSPPVPGTLPPTTAGTQTALPSIMIVSPAFDDSVPAGSIEVSVRVRNFTLTSSTGGENIQGTGHIVYYRDVTPPSRPGEPAIVPGYSVATDQTSCIWESTGPGTHTFAVQLVNNDNTPLQPVVLDAIDLTAYPP